MSVNICAALYAQKRINQLNNIPPPRVELQTNPYINTIYTKHQLDMRRKSEILKYSANSQNSKVNNLTNAQRWANIARGTTEVKQSRINKIINDQLNNIDISCPNDALIETPTSSSDIPGPIIYLIDDESVPLYNYKNTNVYNNLGNKNTNV